MSERLDASETGCGQADATGDATVPPRLEGAQRRLAEAYFDADSGLYILNCVPGAGKSFVRTDIAAKELLQRWVDGDPAPEQHIGVVTFNRSEAASIVDDIITRLRALVAHDQTPAAASVSSEELGVLIERVRQAPYIGTVDSILRTLLSEMLADVGFDEMPAIGNDPYLEKLHADCYEALQTDPKYAPALERLTDAYPKREYDAGVGELLREALRLCRSRRLSVHAFLTRLLYTVDAVYPTGEPTSSEDIVAAIADCITEAEAQTAGETLADIDTDELLEADQELRDAWIERIDDFRTALRGYQEVYEAKTRKQGVISHLDCAYIVAEYLNSDENDGDEDSTRRRVLERHRDRVDSWLIDEAQDISTIQHDALAPLVGSETHVFLAGDIRQSIYGWRDADPELFASAIDDGQYFGVDWEPHVVETATRTYRCRPDIAAAVNTISKPVLTDPVRGNLGSLDIDYPSLEPVRDPTDEPAVHIAAFKGRGFPGTRQYVSPPDRNGEAGVLATYIARGIANNTLTTDRPTPDQSVGGSKTGTSEGSATEENNTASATGSSGECGHEQEPPVTVLFRRRTHMTAYAEAFENEGLEVANASDLLFDCPAIQVIVDVVEWLSHPCDPDSVQSLVTDSPLSVDFLKDPLKHQDWRLDAVVDDSRTLTDREAVILDRLQSLRDRRGIRYAQSPKTLVNAVIDELSLQTDAHNILNSNAPTQRRANLDAFRDWLTSLADGEGISPERFVELTKPFRKNPHKGPRQAVTASGNADVVFKTIHQMKGDEAEVIALADLGFDIWKPGPPNQRFITSGTTVGLAPPETPTIESGDSISMFEGGLYAPSGPNSGPGSTDGSLVRDVGLRWATERWHEPDDDSPAQLAGFDHVQRVSRNARAEAWRVLYVALTRARDHLVVPLPRRVQSSVPARDRWLETLRDRLQFDGSPRAGTYSREALGTGTGNSHFDIGVNDVAPRDGTRSEHQDTPSGDKSCNKAAPTRYSLNEMDHLDSFVPRMIRPSTLGPLVDDIDRWVLRHLQNEPLHTSAETVDPDVPVADIAVGPGEFGTRVHDILTTAIARLDTDSDYSDEHFLRKSVKKRTEEAFPRVSHPERAEIRQFISEQIVLQLLNSGCWKQILAADHLYTEKSIPGLKRREGLEFEFDGAADIVLKHANGQWEVIDLKIALADLTPETRERYQLQVQTYAYFLQEQVGGRVHSRIEILGVDRETIHLKDPGPIKKKLDILIR